MGHRLFSVRRLKSPVLNEGQSTTKPDEKNPRSDRFENNGLFTKEELWRSSRARALRHSRTTIAGREVYRGAQGQ